MSIDAEIPQGVLPKVRWLLTYGTSWMIPLVAIERFADEHYKTGWILVGLTIANLAVISAWDRIATIFGRRKLTMLYVGLLVFCCAGAGFALGKLITRDQRNIPAASDAPDTGRIVWNFYQTARGQGYFLNMNKTGDQEIRVIGFGAHGKNITKDPITEFKGYIRSDITNARLPIFLVAQDLNASPGLIFADAIPTRPEETYGIPGLADFEIVSWEPAVTDMSKDGMLVSQFLREFGTFTLVLEYDGLKIDRTFTTEEIKKQVEMLEFAHRPGVNPASKVTRRPNATVPLTPTLPFPPPYRPPPSRRN